MKKAFCVIWLLSAKGVLLAPSPLSAAERTDSAQQVGETADAGSAKGTSEPAQATETASDTRAEDRDLYEQMAAMQAELERQSKELEALKQQSAAQTTENAKFATELSEVRDDVEMASVEGDESFDTGRLFSIYGFFDLTFFKGFFEKDSLYTMYVPSHSSFAATAANIYFKSRLTDSLSAMAELKFSFLPNGRETSLAAQTILPDGTVVDSPDAYERLDTTVMDPITSMEFQQGGVTIERLHLTYEPFDWLNVIAGRFLTPFGIWNIDHGSTVVLPVRVPIMQYREIVPLAQTGLQIYGRFFPTDMVSIDYALTLSNGRGPMDEVFDLDENKGVGLRLRLTYSGRIVNFTAGAYGYTGKSGDIEKQVVAYLNTNNEMDFDRDRPIRLRIMKTSEFREYTMSYDVSLSFLNITLQSELAYTRVLYSKNEILGPIDAGFNGADLVEEWYMPSHSGYGAYVMLAYILPISVEWLRLTPYVIAEKSAANEVLEASRLESVSAGLNVKPSPFVTIKGEYAMVHSDIFGRAQVMTFQLAVSF